MTAPRESDWAGLIWLTTTLLITAVLILAVVK